jgi:hypothetical protein
LGIDLEPAESHVFTDNVETADNSGDDSDTSSVASTSQKNKKRKTVADFLLEEEQAMVERLEAHPTFCNKKLIS